MIILLLRSLFEWGYLAIQEHRWPDDALFLRAVYRVCLRREPDEIGQRYYLGALRGKTATRLGIMRSVVQSNEFKLLHGFSIHPADAVHQARMMLVQQCLPAARVILDLGGAAKGRPEGALLAMGYPHCPRQIIIVDLPPAEGNVEMPHEWLSPEGIQVIYHLGSMTDLSWLMDESVDLVWAGESIEHVEEWEAVGVAKEVFRVLKPGGIFCFDTPNAALTSLQSPHALIHPEHKREYFVSEMRDMLERAGFRVIEAKGICPMPRSLATGVFDITELVSNIRLSENPEEGYLFFLKAVKPG